MLIVQAVSLLEMVIYETTHFCISFCVPQFFIIILGFLMFSASLSSVSKIASQIADATIDPENLRLELLFQDRLLSQDLPLR